VCPAYVIDCRAAPAVLAVQSVPIEKDEVRPRNSVDDFVDAKKVLDRGSGAAFRARVERPDASQTGRYAARGAALAALSDASSRCRLSTTPSDRLRSFGARPPASFLFPRAGCRCVVAGTVVRSHPMGVGRPTRVAPPLLDFRHATTDNELRM